MRIEKIELYKFEELSPEAQQKAIDNNIEWNVDHREWWDYIYDELNGLGIVCNGFDIGRRWNIDLVFNEFLDTIAEKILKEHVPDCSTYKTSKKFLDDFKKLNKTLENLEKNNLDDSPEHDEILDLIDDCKEVFKSELSEDYLRLLQKEYEYLTSEEAIKESLEANEIEFLKDGSNY